MFIKQDGQEGGLRVDGAAISASWSRVNGIAMTRYNVGSGSHIYTHNSDQGFSVMIYGASDRESYGFALGAGLTNSGVRFLLLLLLYYYLPLFCSKYCFLAFCKNDDE